MELQTEQEKRQIEDAYKDMLKSCSKTLSSDDLELIDKAFNLANQAHMGVKRKSGEPYIMHPIAVAKIASSEIGLGTKSIICSLLHDVVEDTDYTIEDMERLFGHKIASIIDGLTKINKDNFDTETSSQQAENFRKIILTLADDIRVILIKLADRLHNMRTLDSMPPAKQLKIASETIYLYAPLAHRLGLYAIKTELEDLSLKFRFPRVYEEIENKINSNEKKQLQKINHFSLPIFDALVKIGVKFTVSGRPKSIYSIWKKMQNKNVTFEEIYDILAIRIVFEPFPHIPEKTQCWNIYSIITDIYKPKPDRLRDWISTPKANGYEALHCTVMDENHNWVEVQIRTKKMDDIAERGFAAHWKYKEMDTSNQERELDKWIKRVNESLDSSKDSALDFLDEFKMNLFSSEIVVFTPKGEMCNLPKGSTVLDFAYYIHTELGKTAIGARVNHKIVPLSYKLSGGDVVQILDASSQKPTWEMLKIVTTAKAKSAIENALKPEDNPIIDLGKNTLDEILKNLGVIPTSRLIKILFELYEVSSKNELYRKIGLKEINIENLTNNIKKNFDRKRIRFWKIQFRRKNNEDTTSNIDSKGTLIHDDNTDGPSYVTARCCNPIPGDDVIGFLSPDNVIVIHKPTCPEGIRLMAQFGDRIVSANWTTQEKMSFLAHIEINGIDRLGMINEITNVITQQLSVNISKFHIESHEGIFIAYIELYIQDSKHLDNLTHNLSKIKGIDSVKRKEQIED